MKQGPGVDRRLIVSLPSILDGYYVRLDEDALQCASASSLCRLQSRELMVNSGGAYVLLESLTYGCVPLCWCTTDYYRCAMVRGNLSWVKFIIVNCCGLRPSGNWHRGTRVVQNTKQSGMIWKLIKRVATAKEQLL